MTNKARIVVATFSISTCYLCRLVTYPIHSGIIIVSIVYDIVFFPLVAEGPQFEQLIEFDRKNGIGTIRIIDFITSHTDIVCDDFAEMLLKDDIIVRGLKEDYPNKKRFVREVLRKWISNVDEKECTWEKLMKSMTRAGLRGSYIREIGNNIH